MTGEIKIGGIIGDLIEWIKCIIAKLFAKQ